MEEAKKEMTKDRTSGSPQLTDRGFSLIIWGICRRRTDQPHSLFLWPTILLCLHPWFILPIPSSRYSLLPWPQAMWVGCSDLYFCACVCIMRMYVLYV